MESEDDMRFPRYGQYSDPRTTTERVCMWCGKAEVTWQLSYQTCSHRCHAAIHLEVYKEYRLFGFVVPVLAIILMTLNTLNAMDFLVAILISVVVTLMLGFWIYSIWMVRTGNIMREKSPLFQNSSEITDNS